MYARKFGLRQKIGFGSALLVCLGGSCDVMVGSGSLMFFPTVDLSAGTASSDIRAVLVGKDAELKIAHEQIAGLECRMTGLQSEHDRNIAEITTKIEELTAELAGSRKLNADTTARLKTEVAAHADLDETIANLRKEQAALQALFNAKMAEHTAEMAKLQALADDRDSEIQSLTAQVAGLNAQLDRLTAERNEAQGQIMGIQRAAAEILDEKDRVVQRQATALRTVKNAADGIDVKVRLGQTSEQDGYSALQKVVGAAFSKPAATSVLPE